MAIDLPKLIVENFPKRYRFRERVEFYPSDAGKDPCDIYWALTGEPETEDIDVIGKLRLEDGSIFENGFKQKLQYLSLKNVHIIGSQIPVGGTDPLWSGYIDFLIAEKKQTSWETVCLEFKTKWGMGADIIMRDFTPDRNYLIQNGLYMMSMASFGKNVTDGAILYKLLSGNKDVNGHFLQFDFRYDIDKKVVTCYRATSTRGDERELNIVVSLQETLDEWKMIRKCIEEKKLPPKKYFYKHELTDDYLKSLSDSDILKCLNNQKVLGDYQIGWSRYKTLHAKMEGVDPQNPYSSEEVAKLTQEYKKRHPKSKKFTEETL